MTWRYYLQRARNAADTGPGAWLDRDAQLDGVELTWTLTGPGAATCAIDGVYKNAVASDGLPLFDEWSTVLYAEHGDEIVWGGILESCTDTGNGGGSLSFISFSGYPNGRIFMDTNWQYYDTDGFNLIRLLWTYVQGTPFSNLDVMVSDDLAGLEIGGTDPGTYPVQRPGESAATYNARVIAWQNLFVSQDPYQLNYWDAKDVGQEISSIMTEIGGEYVELHAWTDDTKTSISHLIQLIPIRDAPRRFDLRFTEGENIPVAPQPARNGDKYANFVRAMGVGEGSSVIYVDRFGYQGRLRRDLVISDKSITRDSLLQSQASVYFRKAQLRNLISDVTVIDHPNAPIGSWGLGEAIRIQLYSGGLTVDDWYMTTGWSFKPGQSDLATINLEPIYDN